MSTKSKPHLFYYLPADAPRPVAPAIDPGLQWTLWKPSLTDMAPPGVTSPVFKVWWLFHYTRLFANRDYALFVGYKRGRLVHRSGIYPRYLRFPFMQRADVQIGNTWTDPQYRGLGLARYAIAQIVREMSAVGRQFWYLVEPHNTPSIRVIERAGFRLAGTGDRHPRLGLSLLAGYQIDNPPRGART